jgi:hypothetical protein
MRYTLTLIKSTGEGEKTVNPIFVSTNTTFLSQNKKYKKIIIDYPQTTCRELLCESLSGVRENLTKCGIVYEKVFELRIDKVFCELEKNRLKLILHRYYGNDKYEILDNGIRFTFLPSNKVISTLILFMLEFLMFSWENPKFVPSDILIMNYKRLIHKFDYVPQILILYGYLLDNPLEFHTNMNNAYDSNNEELPGDKIRRGLLINSSNRLFKYLLTWRNRKPDKINSSNSMQFALISEIINNT